MVNLTIYTQKLQELIELSFPAVPLEVHIAMDREHQKSRHGLNPVLSTQLPVLFAVDGTHVDN